jgi:hypothetical protein
MATTQEKNSRVMFVLEVSLNPDPYKKSKGPARGTRAEWRVAGAVGGESLLTQSRGDLYHLGAKVGKDHSA